MSELLFYTDLGINKDNSYEIFLELSKLSSDQLTNLRNHISFVLSYYIRFNEKLDDYYFCFVIDRLFKSFAPELWLDTRNLVTNRYKKLKRVENRIWTIFWNSFFEKTDMVFVTLTWRQSVLDSTSEETRRKYVRRWLKANSDIYVANIDFGKINGREHYHCVVNRRVDPTSWPYGACNVKKFTSTDINNISDYIVKLTAHSLKNTTNNRRIIYSRKKV